MGSWARPEPEEESNPQSGDYDGTQRRYPPSPRSVVGRDEQWSNPSNTGVLGVKDRRGSGTRGKRGEAKRGRRRGRFGG